MKADWLNVWILGKVAALIVVGGVGAWFCQKTLNRYLANHQRLQGLRVITRAMLIVWIGLIVMMIMQTLGLPLLPLLTVLSTFGLAVTLGLKDPLSNISSGIILLVYRPFKVGDWISIQGVAGKIMTMNLLSVILEQPDQKSVHLPNNLFIKNFMIHQSKEL